MEAQMSKQPMPWVLDCLVICASICDYCKRLLPGMEITLPNDMISRSHTWCSLYSLFYVYRHDLICGQQIGHVRASLLCLMPVTLSSHAM